jgi:hypothetical protein
MRICLFLTFVPLFLSSGCGGASAGHIEGSVAGKTFDVADSAGNNLTAGANTDGTVVLSSVDSLCSAITANTAKINSQLLSLDIFEADGSNPTAAPTHSGQYAFATTTAGVNGKFFAAFYESIGATTNDVTQTAATGGSLTLNSFANQHYSGSFDLTFGSDHLTGTFDAPRCAGLK